MPKPEMSKEAKEIELGIKKQKLADDIKKFVAEGNSIYDWKKTFGNKANHLRVSYEKLTGEKQSLLDFFVSMGFSAEDYYVPKEVRAQRFSQATTTSLEDRIEIGKERFISEFNAYVEEGNDISNWRETNLKRKAQHLKKLCEKHFGLKLSYEEFFKDVLGFENASEFAPDSNSKLEKRKQEVVNVLSDYLKKNGSLTGWTKVHGLQSKVSHLQEYYQKLEDRNIPIDELFSNYFGFEYDGRYFTFQERMQELSQYADKTGCIDSIRNQKIGTPARNMYLSLSKRAVRLGMAVSDYMILVTDYHFSTGVVPGNYVDYVKMLVEDAFPNKRVENISSIDESLYFKLHYLSNYSLYENMSVEEILENIFGVNTENFNPNKNESKSDEQILVDEQKLVEKLRSYADENGDIAGISLRDPKLYSQVQNTLRGKTMQMFLNQNGLTNSNSTEGPRARFSGIVTTYETRKAELFPIRDQIIAEGQAEGKYNFDKMSDIQKYYAKLEIAQKTIEAYYSQLGLQEYSDEFFEQKPSSDSAEVEGGAEEKSLETSSIGEESQYIKKLSESPLQDETVVIPESPITEESTPEGQGLVQKFLQRKFGSETSGERVEDDLVLEDTEGKID